MSRGGSKSHAQAFIYGGRDRPGEVEVDDVRQELDKDVGSAEAEGHAEAAAAGGMSVAFEDDGWFTPLLVRVLVYVCVCVRVSVRRQQRSKAMVGWLVPSLLVKFLED